MAKKQSLKDRLANQRKEIAAGEGRGSFKVFIFKEGVTRMRPLPVEAEADFAVEVNYLFISKEKGGIVSPSTWGDKCAFMEKYLELKDSKKDKDKNNAKKIKPKKKFMVAHIRYKDEKGKEIDVETGAKLALLTPSQYGDLIDLYLDEDEAGDFTDPKDGYDIKYGRTGKGQFDTEYQVRACKPSALPKPFSKQKYDPVAMAKELTPTYEETVELLEDFLNLLPEDAEPEASGKDKKKDKKKKKNKDL